jgi:molybdate transport system ATP-binding protein
MIDLAIDIVLEQGEFSLQVADRSRVEVLGLFGASGSGKTTLLEAIAGLRQPARGEIVVAGVTFFSSARGTNLAPRDRRVGYVPQDGLLFPHLNVRSNVLFGARSGPAHVEAVAEMLDIAALLRRPVQDLSGGERQRVALARALMTAPTLLLLDEPLAAVDRARRERILPYLLRIRRDLHVPLVYVTHDAAELSQIADRVLVMDNGRAAAAGPPGNVF